MSQSDSLPGPSTQVLTVPEPVVERWFPLTFQWSGKTFSISVAESDRVFDLKAMIQGLTNVPAERQKILGLVKGKLPADDVAIIDIGLVSGKKFSVVGTPEGHEIKGPALESDSINELDIDFASLTPQYLQQYAADHRNKRKVKEYSDKLKVNIIHPLRENKKLLVLDIDYTILDTKPLTSGSLPPAECARPGLHQFLEAIYPYYDICIWSQTSWIWLETKLVELGMIGSHWNYQISFGDAQVLSVLNHQLTRREVLDKTSMFEVFSQRPDKKEPWRHSVKALQIIWNHFPQFDATNTIHVDDLGRNFALNPNEGLKISAFKNAGTPTAVADRELDKLTKYMLHIANTQDLREVSHKDWKGTVKKLSSTPT